MQMLPADRMKTSHHRTSEQRPSVFAAVGRDVPSRIPNPVIDNFVRFAHAAENRIGPELIGLQIDVRNVQPLRGGFLNRFLSRVRDVFRANPAAAHFGGSQHDRPIRTASALNLPFFFRPGQAAGVMLVHLDDAAKQVGRTLTHRLSDAVNHVPAAFLADLQFPLHLERAKRFLGVQHNEDRDKPLPQANVRLVEDRASRGREAIATLKASPLLAGRQFTHLIARATGALNAVWPANLHKMTTARFVVGKLFEQLNQVHGFVIRLGDESAKMKLPRLQSAETSGCGLPRQCCKHRRGFLTPVLSWPRL